MFNTSKIIKYNYTSYICISIINGINLNIGIVIFLQAFTMHTYVCTIHIHWIGTKNYESKKYNLKEKLNKKFHQFNTSSSNRSVFFIFKIKIHGEAKTFRKYRKFLIAFIYFNI